MPATSTSRPPNEVARTTELEIELIELVCAGEKELFYELISPYERSVYMAAFSVLQNEADAEEAAHAGFSDRLKKRLQEAAKRSEGPFCS